MITIPVELQKLIDAHGEASYPYEGCGLLLGQIVDGNNVVERIQIMLNVWPDEEEKRVRFRIDEQAWLKAEMDAMMNDQDIIGVFHSHPDHPPIASPRDLAWAAFSGYSYLITAVRNGSAEESRSWQLNTERTDFSEEEIILQATGDNA